MAKHTKYFQYCPIWLMPLKKRKKQLLLLKDSLSLLLLYDMYQSHVTDYNLRLHHHQHQHHHLQPAHHLEDSSLELLLNPPLYQ
jgi:hypothetical protein